MSVSLRRGLGDRCTLKVARRLRQDTAVQGGTSNEVNFGLDQEDALHVRTCHHSGITRDLPEDILRLCAALQDHFIGRILNQVPRNLNDEDVALFAFEVDVTGEFNVRAEGVDSGRQLSGWPAEVAAEEAGSEIDPRGIGVRAPRGVIVRGSHGADRSGQRRRSGFAVARRVGNASDLRGCRIRSTRGHGQRVEASNGGRCDGRDGDVACDGRGRHAIDAGLGKDRVVACISKFDRLFASAQLALSTSDGLGICRKREEGEENEDASVGEEHRGMRFGEFKKARTCEVDLSLRL
jgi:hypothetical protein